MESPYHGLFAENWPGHPEGWDAVRAEFEMDAPEPFKVIYASYSYEDYSGDADVLWQNADGTFGYVGGGHCSCYGLEGQWSPETYTADQLRKQTERANYGFFSEQRALIASAIEARQGGDGEAGSVHESAAPKADAQGDQS